MNAPSARTEWTSTFALVFAMVLLSGAAARPSAAASRRVPVDFATIQSALDASSAGDTVAIEPGSYAERLTLRSGVTVRAVAGAGSVTVDGQGHGACAVSSLTGIGTRIEGLRLAFGTGHDDGGGAVGGALRVSGGTLDATDCTFESSSALYGGGSAVQSASVTFTRCRWLGTSASYGGGHFQAGGTVRLNDAEFDDVTAGDGGAGYVTMGASLTVQGARVTRAVAQGDGGGFHVESAVVTLSDARLDGARALGKGGGIAVVAGGQVLASFCVLVDNESGQGGGAFHLSCAPASVAIGEAARGAARGAAGTAAADCALLELTNVDVLSSRGAAPAAGAVTDAGVVRMLRSIVAGNSSGLACLDSRATLDVTCSLLYGNGGADLAGPCAPTMDPTNASADPHLCDLPGRDFHLCANSPALDPGCGEPFWGAFGEGCGSCGPTPAAPASWGRVKALYHR